MIGYICLGTNNLERATAFYDELLKEIGAKRAMTDERMIGWQTDQGPLFSIITPYDEEPASVGNGTMIALDVGTGDAVQRFYQKAISLGASDEGAPHDRGSNMGFYGGYFRDLDGNKLVAYCLGWKPGN